MTNAPSSYAIYAFTPEGVDLAFEIQKHLPGDVFVSRGAGVEGRIIPFESLRRLLPSTFFKYTGHIFICATGIVVRSIAPLLQGKDMDPAVVVIDQKGRFAISLISGHLGGANELCRRLSDMIGAIPVITTATDVEGLPSIDEVARKRNIRVYNISAIKYINMAILKREPFYLFDPFDFFDIKADFSQIAVVKVHTLSEVPPAVPLVVCHYKRLSLSRDALILCPPLLYVGVGCNRGTLGKDIYEFIVELFERYGFYTQSICELVSTEKKNTEQGIYEAASMLGVRPRFLNHIELGGISVPNPSKIVEKHMGVKSVCEAAALLASKGKLILEKHKTRDVTIAVALAP